eukprot:scaffold2193_cov74-Phaeocystis_antarctica.AAC.8
MSRIQSARSRRAWRCRGCPSCCCSRRTRRSRRWGWQFGSPSRTGSASSLPRSGAAWVRMGHG